MDTKEKYLEILEFKHFCHFWYFQKTENNEREKRLMDSITVVVAVDVVTGNTIQNKPLCNRDTNKSIPILTGGYFMNEMDKGFEQKKAQHFESKTIHRYAIWTKNT